MPVLNRSTRPGYLIVRPRHEPIPPKAINAEPGTYAVTGSDASTVRGYAINAEPGTYAITGAVAQLVKGYTVDAQPGTYTVTGVDASTVKGYVVDAQPGAYAVTGVDADLVHVVPAERRRNALRFDREAQDRSRRHLWARRTIAPGVPVHQTPVTVVDYAINAEPGTYTISGSEASLEATTLIRAQSAYLEDGETLARAAMVRRSSRARYIYNRSKPVTIAAHTLDAQPASYTITGVAADLQLVGAIVLNAEPGTYAITGVTASTVTARLITASPTTYAVTGLATDLDFERALNAAAATYTVTGVAATLLAPRTIDAQPAVYVITGRDATLSALGAVQPGHVIASAGDGVSVVTVDVNGASGGAQDAGAATVTVAG